MPNIDLSILNQRQTPAFYADVFANRPAAGFVGRIFVSTDTYAFYRDNGTGWDLIGGPGTGTVTGSGAAGQVAFWSGSSLISGENNLWWDSTNNHFGINTNTPGTAADIHHNQSTILQLNQTTATNDTRIAFQNSGTSLWRIGNFYNGGANDLGIFDVVGNIQPVTVKKNTGQVLIGTSTVGAGKLVVASASSDNGIQIVGASAPSLRIDSAESGPTKRAGLGISTATNNFIQGSADRDFCIFNGSTAAASPILFGIYDAGAVNVQEAARISAARNFLIGTTTDAGQKLQVSGTSYISGNTSIGTTLNTYILQTSADGAAGQVQLDQYGNVGSNILLRSARGTSAAPTATTAGDLLGSIGSRGYDGTNFSGGGRVGMYMYAAENFTATNQGSFLIFGTTPIGTASRVERIRITDAGYVGINTNSPIERLTNNGLLAINGASVTSYYVGNNNSAFIDFNAGDMRIGSQSSAGNSTIQFYTTSGGYTNISERGRFTSSGNLLIGTTTDAGDKLQVSGTALITGSLTTGSPIGIKGTTPFIQWLNNSSTRLGYIQHNASNLVYNADTGQHIFNQAIQISNTVTAAVGVASTHKVSILINGVQYYLLASNV